MCIQATKYHPMTYTCDVVADPIQWVYIYKTFAKNLISLQLLLQTISHSVKQNLKLQALFHWFYCVI